MTSRKPAARSCLLIEAVVGEQVLPGIVKPMSGKCRDRTDMTRQLTRTGSSSLAGSIANGQHDPLATACVDDVVRFGSAFEW